MGDPSHCRNFVLTPISVRYNMPSRRSGSRLGNNKDAAVHKAAPSLGNSAVSGEALLDGTIKLPGKVGWRPHSESDVVRVVHAVLDHLATKLPVICRNKEAG